MDRNQYYLSLLESRIEHEKRDLQRYVNHKKPSEYVVGKKNRAIAELIETFNFFSQNQEISSLKLNTMIQQIKKSGDEVGGIIHILRFDNKNPNFAYLEEAVR